MPERWFRERHRCICAVGMFQDKRSALGVSMAVILRVSEGWAPRRYMDIAPLNAIYTTTAT
jgi:hypothetical protein